MNSIKKVRLIVFGSIGILAILVFFFGSPNQNLPENNDEQSTHEQMDWDSIAEAINARNNINNRNASGAPQQTVVNGWTTIDWLELISEQLQSLSNQDQSSTSNNVATNNDNRTSLLLLLLVFGACFEWATKDLQLDMTTIKQENLEEAGSIS